VNSGVFEHFSSGVALSNIAASGTFEKLDGKPEKLKVTQFNAGFEKGNLSASGVVAEFTKPWIDLNVNGSFDLNDLRKFAQLDNLSELDGKLKINASFEGKLGENGRLSPYVLSHCKSKGEMDFEGGSFKLKDSPHSFHSLDGKFALENADARIVRFSGNVGDSDFSLNGYFRNFLPYLLLNNQTLAIDASFSSSNMDFTPLLSTDDGLRGSSQKQEYRLQFPDDIDFSLDLAVNSMKFREFRAQAINGKARLVDQVLTLDQIDFETADGIFKASATADGRNNSAFDLVCNAHFDGIDINKLFHEFENFSQDFITEDHLRGKATADVLFKAPMSSDLKFKSQDIYCEVDIEVKNGELIELRSMENISEYIQSNLLVSEFVDEASLGEKLGHIYFSTLENTIEISNGQIIIPTMVVSSSAMDITANGTHSFDNEVEYTVGFKIRDVMSQSKDSEFGIVEDDGLSNSFFMKMWGPVENPEFGYDRLAHREKRKNDREKEKENVRNILKSEFGKKGDEKTAEDNHVIAVSFDEDKDEPKKEKEKKSLKDLLKKEKEEEEEEVIIVVEDDDDF
jgi:uncharacterized protein involved in outer membrane biogenesis